LKQLSLFVACGATLNLMLFVVFHFRKYDEPVDYMHKIILDETSPYHEGEFEYRTDFGTFYANVTMLNNRASTMTFNSICNKRINELRLLLTHNLATPTFRVHKQKVAFDALMSVRDFIDYREGTKEMPDSVLVQKDSTSLYTCYEYKYYIPMGFSYDDYVTRDEFYEYLKSSPKDSVTPLLDKLVIEKCDEAALSKVLRHSSLTSAVTIDSLVDARRRYCATKFEGDTRGLKMETDFDRERVVFLSVVSDPGFAATIDGKPTKIYRANLGLSAIIVPKGKHYIDFDYTTPGLRLGSVISLIALLLLILIAYRERKMVTPPSL
jgi:hypothetical protein